MGIRLLLNDSNSSLGRESVKGKCEIKALVTGWIPSYSNVSNISLAKQLYTYRLSMTMITVNVHSGGNTGKTHSENVRRLANTIAMTRIGSKGNYKLGLFEGLRPILAVYAL